MTLADVLQQLRTLYVEELSARCNGFSAELRGALLPEALYQLTTGEPIRSGPLALPARGDLCVLREQKISELARIESPRALEFEPFRFLWADAMQVALHPFDWDDCSLCVPEPVEAIDFAPLQAWAEDAFKPGERAATMDAHGVQLLNVIHRVSAPRTVAEGTRIDVDLGSAPVREFERLLDALVVARVGLVVVGRVDVGGGGVRLGS